MMERPDAEPGSQESAAKPVEDLTADANKNAGAAMTMEHGKSAPPAMIELTENPEQLVEGFDTTGKNQNHAGSPSSSWKIQAASLVVILAIVVIVVAIVMTRDQEEAEEDVYVPETMNFITGVSLITSYGINATISQRLARTVLTIDIANALDCVSVHGLSLQLPMAARVASLRTITEDGSCSTVGKVQTLEEARETFVENAANGLPGAYVEEQDSVSYSVQVTLPPLGQSRVELVVEEILRQRVGQVEFQIPLIPNEEVDQLSLDITILDAGLPFPVVDFAPDLFTTSNNTQDNTQSITGSEAGPTFSLYLGSDLVGSNKSLSPFHLDIPDAREYKLPRVLNGHCQPGVLPDSGVLYTDGACFEHYFLPASLEPKAKNVFILWDVGSYGWGQGPMGAEVKTAVKAMIDALEVRDTLTIQTFGQKGTEGLWGSAKVRNF